MSLRPKRNLSRQCRLWLAAGAVVCAAVVTLSRVVRPARMTGDAELEGLLERRAALEASDDRIRDELRREAAAISGRVPAPPALAELRAALGPAWRWREMPGGFTVAREVSRRDWAAVAAAVETLERGPGVALRSLAIEAGDAPTRRGPLRVAIEVGGTP